MSELRQRMIEDLQLRGMSERTQQSEDNLQYSLSHLSRSLAGVGLRP